MKRKNNSYNKIYDINNIISAYDEVCKNTRNKNKCEKRPFLLKLHYT